MSRQGMLVPERDLKGATPELLAAALLRRTVKKRPDHKPKKTTKSS